MAVEIAILVRSLRAQADPGFMSDERWRQLHFDNVYVPAEMVLLKEGGFRKQIAGFDVERLGNSARSIALGRFAYDLAREWAMQRKRSPRLHRRGDREVGKGGESVGGPNRLARFRSPVRLMPRRPAHLSREHQRSPERVRLTDSIARTSPT